MPKKTEAQKKASREARKRARRDRELKKMKGLTDEEVAAMKEKMELESRRRHTKTKNKKKTYNDELYDALKCGDEKLIQQLVRYIYIICLDKVNKRQTDAHTRNRPGLLRYHEIGGIDGKEFSNEHILYYAVRCGNLYVVSLYIEMYGDDHVNMPAFVSGRSALHICGMFLFLILLITHFLFVQNHTHHLHHYHRS